MPIIEAGNAYDTEVLQKQVLEEQSYYRIAEGTLLSHGSLEARLRATLDVRSADEQFRTDVALWYGAIHWPGTPWKADLIQRVFGVLFFGPPPDNRHGGW